jgi:lysozyme
MTTYVRGIDVSRYQPKVDWARVKAAGIAFAVPKASQSNWADPMFATHWAGAKSAGLLRGAYHFFVPDMDPLKQAAAYLKALGDDPGDLPPVLDIEAKTTDAAALAKNAQVWLAEVEKQLKKQAIIYTAAWYWNGAMLVNGKYPAWAADYALWVAAYPVKDGAPTLEQLAQGKYKPLLPKSWTKWTFWQYSEKGRVDGITNADGKPANVDLNVFEGTLEDLGKFAGLDPARLADLPSYDAPVSFAAPGMIEEPSHGDASDVSGTSARLTEAMEAGAPAKTARKPARRAAKKPAKPAKKAARPAKKKPAKAARKPAGKPAAKKSARPANARVKRSATSRRRK